MAKAAPTVAVVGAGPSGLSMTKTLKEDGYDVTLYERRSKVGGLWAYSDDTAHTIALPRTRANISKFTCGFSDFPMPDKYPLWMTPAEFTEFMHDYAVHFDFYQNIVFNTSVKQASRNSDDTKWRLDIETNGKAETVEFDKIVFCHGYQTKAAIPTFEGQDKFEDFKGKRVVVVGLGSTTGDIVPDIMPHAEKVWVSHRRGALPFKRVRNGTPVDLNITWRRRQMSQFLQRYAPGLAKFMIDKATNYFATRMFKLDPAWRLTPVPSVLLTLPGSFEDIMPFLADGRLTSLHGLKRFVGPKSLEFDDGTVLDDIDAVIFCTGYKADWSVAPFVQTSKPTAHNYNGAPIHRMYMNLFPPAYWDSCAMLCYSAYGKSNGFSFADVTSLAISNVWRGVEKLPPRDEMEQWIDEHQAWVAGRWKLDQTVDESMVKQWEFQGWLHKAAGTGMENLGWGWKGWMFWLKDRKMYNLLNNGVETAHMYRFFETGKRRTWPGAREAILHMNEVVKNTFPLKDEVVKKYGQL
ncbi:putative flavin containing monooxygenase 9 protein [Phaeoacremonium minimum UCRPA7]|uniref:Putative flavin containing monooxygenase 9 protein n=1 Tax=Phaeoacremonium minimum (strain UCR-PA7) TaxID=1286976 RepID=R8BJ47_PHAM7|nr:putative flavin containing monooxygenase 9 protein [Phaeoacremonium minimum UCRPA7]EON99272.1 putative flavin containing monooxygenase 9 protein [Phaeoacremonium minimum UCRPA7]